MNRAALLIEFLRLFYLDAISKNASWAGEVHIICALYMCGELCTPILVILCLHGAEKFFDSYLAWRVKLAMFHEWHNSITDYCACEKLSSGDRNFVVCAIMFQREVGSSCHLTCHLLIASLSS